MSVSAATPPAPAPASGAQTPPWTPPSPYDENSPPLLPGDRENPFRKQVQDKGTNFDVSNIYYQNPKKLEFLANAPKAKSKPVPAPRQDSKPPVPEKRECLRVTPLRGVSRIPSAKKKFSPKLSRKKEPTKAGIVDLLRNLVADDDKDKPKAPRDGKSNIKAFITAGADEESERGRAPPPQSNKVSARAVKPEAQTAWANTAPARRLETSFLSSPPENQQPLRQHQRSQSLSPIARQRATSPPASLPDTSRILEERLTEIRQDLWGRPTTLPVDGGDSDASTRKSIQERTLEYYATAIQRQLQGPRGRTDTPDYSSTHSSRSTLVSSPTPTEPLRRRHSAAPNDKKIRQELLDFYYRSIERDRARQRRSAPPGRSGRLSAPPVPYAFAPPATPTPSSPSPVLIPLTHGDFLRQEFLPEHSTYQNLPIRVRPAVPQRTESLPSPSTPSKSTPPKVDMNLFVRNSPQRSTIGPISTAKRTPPTIHEEDDVQLRHPDKTSTPKSRPKNLFEAWMSNGRKSKTPPNKTAPIFKRGSLQQVPSPGSEGAPALPKRVSFSSSSSPMHASGEWPTRNGPSQQPPSRQPRLDSCDSDVFLPDGVLVNGCCSPQGYYPQGHYPQGQYIQGQHDDQLYANAAACPDRPLPPIPADARPSALPPGLYGSHQHAQSESESGSEAGEVRRILQQAPHGPQGAAPAPTAASGEPDRNASYFNFQGKQSLN